MCHCKLHQTYRRFATRHNQLIPIFRFGNRNKSSNLQHRHWLSGKSPQIAKTQIHNSLCQQTHQNVTGTGLYNNGAGGKHDYSRTLNRPLPMNLENDMYYTVDFSDSQNSPLIQ